ncbi:sodium bicarbonate cotransporter 3-like [Sinocyclocheilus grahami]|uniref:sodium bicarbonate cotransporter 3-like n=1 Tax=Sinocyclocheilus grahami TaxID=75366 RepID=UPI0007AD50EC|nr:PREDICTED: sodium bicarbonate cotransporter 3-like [Sinocyclocheilus grahami]
MMQDFWGEVVNLRTTRGATRFSGNDEEAVVDQGKTSSTIHTKFEKEELESHRAVYVGVHVPLGRQSRRRHRHRGHKHHRKRKDRGSEREDGRESPVYDTPSQRVQFILGTEDDDEEHIPHDLFTELDELSFHDGQAYEWKETARWLKFEEDVEDGGERWSKPYVATLSLHSLFELRSCILSGTVMLDMRANTIEEIADMVIDNMVASEQLDESLRENVRNAMLKRHHHQNEKKLSNRIPLVRSFADIGKKHSDPHLLERNGEGLSASRLSLIRRASSTSTSTPPRSRCPSRESRSSRSSIILNQLLPSANSSPNASPSVTPQNTPPTAHRAASSLRSPGPSQQGPELLVARGWREDIPEVVVFPPEEEEEEEEMQSWFSTTQEEQVAHDPARLAQLLPLPQSGKYPAHQLEVITAEDFSFAITRIYYISKYITIGRKLGLSLLLIIILRLQQFHLVLHNHISTFSLTQCQIFHDVAYKAKDRNDLLSGIDEFLDQVTVLPPGEWDPTIRIEPPKSVPSQEKRKMPSMPNGSSPLSEMIKEEEDHTGPELQRTGRSELVKPPTIYILHTFCFFCFFAYISHYILLSLSIFKAGIGRSLDLYEVQSTERLYCISCPKYDLCRLGSTSTYWRSMVRDPVLWKYFLLRDMPLWQSVDHSSVPQVKLTGSAVLDDSEMQLDYMAEYLRVCPACRNQWQHQPRVFESVTSFFQSLVPVSEPQFAMFGPGLEQLEISLMNTIMCSPHVLPVAGLPQRQIDGATALDLESVLSTKISTDSILQLYIRQTDNLDNLTFYTCQCSPPSNITEKMVQAWNQSDFNPEIINWSELDVPNCKKLHGEFVGPACGHNGPYIPDVLFWSVILFFTTFFLSSFLKQFKTKHYFPTKVRSSISDFAVFLTIMIMVLVDYLVGVPSPKLHVPDTFEPTSKSRGWLISPLGDNPTWTLFAAAIPALLCTILIFMDQQITAVIINRKEHKLKKGCGYHLDLLVVAVMLGVCSVMGLPWFVAATVLSISHVNSLKVESECSAPGEQPKFLGIREQRVTGFMIFVLMGLSVFMTSILKFIPMPVLYGVFLYMGVSSLKGIQFFDRIKLFGMPAKHQPDLIYLRYVPLWKVHIFTIVQLTCLVLLWVIKASAAAVVFPMMVLALVFVRKLLDFCFLKRELSWLDDLMPESKKKKEDDKKKKAKEEAQRMMEAESGMEVPYDNGDHLEIPVKSLKISTDPSVVNISDEMAKTAVWRAVAMSSDSAKVLKPSASEEKTVSIKINAEDEQGDKCVDTETSL